MAAEFNCYVGDVFCMFLAIDKEKCSIFGSAESPTNTSTFRQGIGGNVL